MERRGGFRVNPLNWVQDTLDRLTKRRVATGLRGVYISPDALVDDWIEIGTTDDPFLNSWVNFASGNATAAYRKDGEGTVHIKGLVKSGTIGQPIFTLPVGFRPLLDHNIATISNEAVGRLEIEADGDVVPAIGDNTFFSIHISFPAEQ